MARPLTDEGLTQKKKKRIVQTGMHPQKMAAAKVKE